MAIKFSETQVNLARKKYYGKFYFTENLNIVRTLVNRILILFFNLKIFFIIIIELLYSFFPFLSHFLSFYFQRF